MLEWTARNKPSLMLIVHHSASHVGKLDKAWDEATAKGWIFVDMKNDWSSIFPSSQSKVATRAASLASEAKEK